MGEKRITDFDIVDPDAMPNNAAVYTVLPSEVTPELIERHFNWLDFKNWFLTFGNSILDVVLNTTHRSSNGVDHFNLLNSLKGMNHIILTNYKTTGKPAIVANSQIEINGAIYTNPTEVAITGVTPNDSWRDILLTPNGTSFLASFIAPGIAAWSDSRQGIYSGNDRVPAIVFIDGSGDFINKNVLIVNNRTVEIKMQIGSWSMVAESAIALDMYTLGSMLRSVYITIIQDASLNITPLGLGEFAIAGNYAWEPGNPGIAIVRTSGGFYDSSGYNDLNINRGFITITYEV